MSIIQAMLAGTSALTHYGDAMTVIGNNLANAQTTGFKGSRSTFQDVLIQTIGVSGIRPATQIGTGVGLASVDQDMKQGALNGTSRVSDLAVDGKGYFQVRDSGAVPLTGVSSATSSSASDKVYYTRSGSFQKDQEGYLVNNAGLRLQGRRLNEDGSLSGEQPGDINLHYSSVGPLLHKAGKATDVVHLSANLSSMTTPEEAITYEPNNPNSYDYAVTVHVYDSRGTGHNVDVHFRREPIVEGSTTATWSWYVVAPSAEVETSETGALVNVLGGQTKGGTLTFDQDGRLVSDALDPKVADSVKMTFLGTGGQPTTEQTIQFDFGTSRAEDPENASAGRSGTVQLASDSSIFNLAQNGYGIGYLEEINISEDGNIYGSYSNGQVQAMYQIALVDFADEQGLDQVGANLYVETNASGVAQVNRAQSGRLGSIRAFTLEQSNVDMASEFVTMIAMQRAFQANSRIVSVTDGMLEELLSLKR